MSRRRDEGQDKKHGYNESWFKQELKKEVGVVRGWFKKDKPVGNDVYSQDVAASNSIAKRRKSGMRRALIFISVFIGVVVVAIFVVGAMFVNSLKYGEHEEPENANKEQYEQTEINEDAELIEGQEDINHSDIFVPESNIESVVKTEGLHYILLIGLDARNSTNWEHASTDVMKLLVIDENTNDIKMLSLMRDILVPIDGQTDTDGTQKFGKLNSVYFYNGPEGLCETVTSCFGVPIDNYIIINWAGITKLIDAVGGVEIDLTYSEMKHINDLLNEQNGISSLGQSKYLYKDGEQVLNGSQALAYMRIRHVGNGDFDRVQRQVVVLQSLFDSMNTASLNELLALTTTLQEVVRTDANAKDLIDYTNMGYGMLDAQMSSLRIPAGAEGQTYSAGSYNNRYVLNVDFENNIDAINEFLYWEYVN